MHVTLTQKIAKRRPARLCAAHFVDLGTLGYHAISTKKTEIQLFPLYVSEYV